MAQTALTIRMDTELKTQFDALCDEFGMSTNTAFNIFARAVVRKRMIPFIIESATKSDMIERGRIGFDEIKAMSLRNELPDLTLDEINEEIRRVREEKK